MKHTKTDPACTRYRLPRTPWAKWWHKRGRGHACITCMHMRSIIAAAQRRYLAQREPYCDHGPFDACRCMIMR